MTLKSGFLKMAETGRGTLGLEEGKQQPALVVPEPIPLPTDAFKEVLRFVPQAPLTLANSQLAAAVLSVTNCQHREVSPPSFFLSLRL